MGSSEIGRSFYPRPAAEVAPVPYITNSMTARLGKSLRGWIDQYQRLLPRLACLAAFRIAKDPKALSGSAKHGLAWLEAWLKTAGQHCLAEAKREPAQKSELLGAGQAFLDIHAHLDAILSAWSQTESERLSDIIARIPKVSDSQVHTDMVQSRYYDRAVQWVNIILEQVASAIARSRNLSGTLAELSHGLGQSLEQALVTAAPGESSQLLSEIEDVVSAESPSGAGIADQPTAAYMDQLRLQLPPVSTLASRVWNGMNEAVRGTDPSIFDTDGPPVNPPGEKTVLGQLSTNVRHLLGNMPAESLGGWLQESISDASNSDPSHFFFSSLPHVVTLCRDIMPFCDPGSNEYRLFSLLSDSLKHLSRTTTPAHFQAEHIQSTLQPIMELLDQHPSLLAPFIRRAILIQLPDSNAMPVIAQIRKLLTSQKAEFTSVQQSFWNLVLPEILDRGLATRQPLSAEETSLILRMASWVSGLSASQSIEHSIQLTNTQSSENAAVHVKALLFNWQQAAIRFENSQVLNRVIHQLPRLLNSVEQDILGNMQEALMNNVPGTINPALPEMTEKEVLLVMQWLTRLTPEKLYAAFQQVAMAASDPVPNSALQRVAERWRLEVNFQDVKHHVNMGLLGNHAVLKHVGAPVLSSIYHNVHTLLADSDKAKLVNRLISFFQSPPTPDQAGYAIGIREKVDTQIRQIMDRLLKVPDLRQDYSRLSRKERQVVHQFCQVLGPYLLQPVATDPVFDKYTEIGIVPQFMFIQVLKGAAGSILRFVQSEHRFGSAVNTWLKTDQESMPGFIKEGLTMPLSPAMQAHLAEVSVMMKSAVILAARRINNESWDPVRKRLSLVLESRLKPVLTGHRKDAFEGQFYQSLYTIAQKVLLEGYVPDFTKVQYQGALSPEYGFISPQNGFDILKRMVASGVRTTLRLVNRQRVLSRKSQVSIEPELMETIQLRLIDVIEKIKNWYMADPDNFIVAPMLDRMGRGLFHQSPDAIPFLKSPEFIALLREVTAPVARDLARAVCEIPARINLKDPLLQIMKDPEILNGLRENQIKRSG